GEAGLRELFQHETMLGLVAETSLLGTKQVAGYLFARAIREEAEILNLAVLPEFRRQGLGRQLLAVALERLSTTGIAMVYLEVRESNVAARALYSLEGFSAVGEDRVATRCTFEQQGLQSCGRNGALLQAGRQGLRRRQHRVSHLAGPRGPDPLYHRNHGAGSAPPVGPGRRVGGAVRSFEGSCLRAGGAAQGGIPRRLSGGAGCRGRRPSVLNSPSWPCSPWPPARCRRPLHRPPQSPRATPSSRATPSGRSPGSC